MESINMCRDAWTWKHQWECPNAPNVWLLLAGSAIIFATQGSYYCFQHLDITISLGDLLLFCPQLFHVQLENSCKMKNINELWSSRLTSVSQMLVHQQDGTHTCGVLQLLRDFLCMQLCSSLSSFSLAFFCTGSSSCRNGSVQFTFQRLHPLVKNLIHRREIPINRKTYQTTNCRTTVN